MRSGKVINVNVADHGGSGGFCVGEDRGAELHERIRNGLNADMIIDLNFSGVTHLTTHFLDASIGQLYGEYPDEFVDRLNFSAIEPDDLELVRRIIANAKHYFLYPRRWQSPGRMVEESERLAVGCRVLAGYIQGRKLWSWHFRESVDPDYMLGWKLGAARKDKIFDEMQARGNDLMMEMAYRTFYGTAVDAICRTFGTIREELAEPVNTVPND